MFKRSLLSLMLVASLVCPAAAQAGWKESAQSSLSDFSGAVSAVFSPSTYTKAFQDVRGAYRTGFCLPLEPLKDLDFIQCARVVEKDPNGLKAVGQALLQNKSAVAGVVLGVTALSAISYVAYNKWFTNKTTSTTDDPDDQGSD